MNVFLLSLQGLNFIACAVQMFNDHEGGGGLQEREQRAWLAGRL